MRRQLISPRRHARFNEMRERCGCRTATRWFEQTIVCGLERRPVMQNPNAPF
jgi:hypothetical protein